MIIRIFKIVGIITLLFLVLSLDLAYKDLTCHGCLHIPSLKTATSEKSLVAIYRCSNDIVKDILYLTQGGVHGSYYGSYSKVGQ